MSTLHAEKVRDAVARDQRIWTHSRPEDRIVGWRLTRSMFPRARSQTRRSCEGNDAHKPPLRCETHKDWSAVTAAARKQGKAAVNSKLNERTASIRYSCIENDAKIGDQPKMVRVWEGASIDDCEPVAPSRRDASATCGKWGQVPPRPILQGGILLRG